VVDIAEKVYEHIMKEEMKAGHRHYRMKRSVQKKMWGGRQCREGVWTRNKRR
jgi:hypothetical protein